VIDVDNVGDRVLIGHTSEWASDGQYELAGQEEQDMMPELSVV
jgi:hypothetical protein